VTPVLMLPHTGRHYSYTLKEGEEFDVLLHMWVCGETRGLRFTNTVYKLGLPVDRTRRVSPTHVTKPQVSQAKSSLN